MKYPFHVFTKNKFEHFHHIFWAEKESDILERKMWKDFVANGYEVSCEKMTEHRQLVFLAHVDVVPQEVFDVSKVGWL